MRTARSTSTSGSLPGLGHTLSSECGVLHGPDGCAVIECIDAFRKAGNTMAVSSSHVDTFARDNLPPRDQWPDLIFTIPEVQYPDRVNCIAELLDRHVRGGLGDHPAIYSEQGTLTYAQLQEQVDKVAHVLTHDMGLVPGNRVLLRS